MGLAGVAGLIVILLAIVLATPFEVELSAAKAADDPAVRVQAKFSWLGFNVPGRSTARNVAKTRPKTGRRQASIGWSTPTAVITSPGFMQRFVHLATDEIRLTRPRSLFLRARLGFDDPSDTGMFLGWLYAFRGLPESHAMSVYIEPDFTGEAAEGEMRAHWSLRPGAVVWPLLKFCASPVVWRAGRGLVTRRLRDTK